MKKILISENAYKRLFLTEAALDGFSLEELSKLKSFAEQIRYCKNMLGTPIGKGSSRTVFQIDDNKVLKLAHNQKGLVQNSKESLNYSSYDIFTEVFESDDDDKWVVSEYVLPAKAEDFKKVFGMNFKSYCNIVSLISAQYERGYNSYSNEDYDKFEEYKYNEPTGFFIDLNSYMTDYMLPKGDLLRISTYGLTTRDGKPYIVILDNGLDENVFNTYYKH